MYRKLGYTILSFEGSVKTKNDFITALMGALNSLNEKVR